ncbi:hypothetical protein BDW67DRAFT_145854 [Aspergillus spinulosporus]
MTIFITVLDILAFLAYCPTIQIRRWSLRERPACPLFPSPLFSILSPDRLLQTVVAHRHSGAQLSGHWPHWMGTGAAWDDLYASPLSLGKSTKCSSILLLFRVVLLVSNEILNRQEWIIH